ncbi:MAG: metalloregulator ArsR/SmtB family transcription factor [Candidatus Paceibacterota bacterium]
MTKLSYVPVLVSRKKSAPEAFLIIKILANRSRYSIMALLLGSERDLCVHEISERLSMTQSATSHQLSFLEGCGVVESVRMGKTKCYLPTTTARSRKINGIIKLLRR